MTRQKSRRAQEKSGTGTLVPARHRIERAAGDLRRGVPVLIAAGNERALVAAAETVSDATLRALAKRAAPLLVLTHARAQTLKIRLYTPDVVGIRLALDSDAASVAAIADPAADLAHPLKGPFETLREPLPAAAAAAVHLAKLAGLLPAAILVPSGPIDARAEALAEVRAEEIAAFDAETAHTLKVIARTRVPLEGAESCELVAFRPADGGPEHYALLIGESGSAPLATPGPVLARLHSECFTGDFLGSLRCDCGDQLRGAVAAIAAAGGGLLLYLAQEGRGIGLTNKLKAYALQDQGFDTMEANARLGFADDERLYDIAAKMLALLGYDAVRLMTNNPEKIRALEAAGIEVAERVPHSFPSNAHNRDYLAAKAKRGHLL